MKRRTLALGLLTGLTGCSILPERPPLKLYTLLANLSAQNCSAPKRRLSSVRINSPMIASPYDSTRCYVLAKDSRVYNTDINRFSSNPGNFIGDGLREVIQNCGPWNVVLSLIPSVLLLINSQSLFPSSSSMLFRSHLLR